MQITFADQNAASQTGYFSSTRDEIVAKKRKEKRFNALIKISARPRINFDFYEI